MSSSDSDPALVARCTAGDVDALGDLYDQFGGRAYALARRITGDDASAEAVVEAAFLDAWREAFSFDPARARVSAWLLGFVHRRAVDAVRGERRRTAGVAARSGALETGEAAAAGAEGEAVRAALAQLEPEERRVLELAYFEGYTQAEIAELLGEPAASVASTLHSALMTLRHLLGSVRK
ncbi:MAG TPA: sigma-70 family RNA polymerase sigma factor [Gaiellaceae bacterium]|nr:sigma-70 family RNA polymerase sigma factor [Gaiellaceae bacterium]